MSFLYDYDKQLTESFGRMYFLVNTKHNVTWMYDITW